MTTTLPPFLFDSRKLYKEDTNTVVTWLAETAQKCGHVLKLPAESPASRPSGRLKGKARKLAREIERAAGAEASTSALRHTIPVNQLTDLAHLIAKHKPPVKVPQIISRLLDRAIGLRKRCATWFQNKAVTDQGLSANSKHWHFIGILESVLQILHPNWASDTANSAHQSKIATPSTNAPAKSECELDNLVNLYDVLYIDDLDEDSTAAPTLATPVKNAASPKKRCSETRKIVYEAETTMEEVYFAMFCFFNDLNRLREFLRNLWQQYDAGTLNLMTVSVTTNTAINIVRRAEQDLVTTFPILESYDKITRTISGLMYEIRGEDPSAPDDPDNVLTNDAILNLADWVYLSPHSIIKTFCKATKSYNMSIDNRADYAGFYNPSISSHERMDLNGFILIDGLTELSYVAKYGYDVGLPVVDELIEGLHSAFIDEAVPLWVAYAAQIFVDIQIVLRDNVARGLSELQTSGTQIASSLKEYHRLNRPVAFAQRPDFFMGKLQELIDNWVLGDAYDHFKYGALELSDPDPTESFALFKRHPVLCGLFQFKLYSYAQYISLDLVNTWWSVLNLAHLYQACRQGGHLKQIWPDMELVMDIHTHERMFAGRIPQTPAESLKCLELMLGVSPVNFARDSRLNRTQISKNRGLTFNTPVMNLFHKQWVENGDTVLKMSSVYDLLRSHKFASTPAPPGEDQSWMQKQWTTDYKMTPLQLLDILSKAISAEEHVFRFDYIALHVRCLEFLRTLGTILDQQLRHHVGPNYIANEAQVCCVVTYIFTEAAGIGKWQQREPGFKSSTFKQVSELVAAFIERQGSLECDKLKKRCLQWEKKNKTL